MDLMLGYDHLHDLYKLVRPSDRCGNIQKIMQKISATSCGRKSRLCGKDDRLCGNF